MYAELLGNLFILMGAGRGRGKSQAYSAPPWILEKEINIITKKEICQKLKLF
jgi:hypothetical protein